MYNGVPPPKPAAKGDKKKIDIVIEDEDSFFNAEIARGDPRYQKRDTFIMET